MDYDHGGVPWGTLPPLGWRVSKTTAKRFLLLVPFLLACTGRDARDEAAGAPDPGAPYLAALAATLERSGELADSVDDLLQPVPLLAPGQEAALRSYLNDVHVARARELGVRVRSEEHRDSLVQAGVLVPLEDSTSHWIVRGRGDRDFVVPHTRALLEEVAGRFQERLAGMGLPRDRIEITSTLRTAAQQASLRTRNPNAALGASSHEFGTTVDISYAAFAPPLELPEHLWSGAPPRMRPHLARVAAVTLESVSARKSRELQAILGAVLIEAQREGIVRVIYERQQPVYHVTVASPLADRP